MPRRKPAGWPKLMSGKHLASGVYFPTGGIEASRICSAVYFAAASINNIGICRT